MHCATRHPIDLETPDLVGRSPCSGNKESPSSPDNAQRQTRTCSQGGADETSTANHEARLEISHEAGEYKVMHVCMSRVPSTHNENANETQVDHTRGKLTLTVSQKLTLQHLEGGGAVRLPICVSLL